MGIIEEEMNINVLDGNNWNMFGSLGKSLWAAGFIGGVGIACTQFRGPLVRLDDIKNRVEEIGDFEFIVKKEIEKIDIPGITAGQMREGIDKFYSDFNNKTIKMVDAVYVVKMRVKGENPKAIDTQIKYLRMQPITKDVRIQAWTKVWWRKTKYGLPEYKDMEEGKFSEEDAIKAGIFIDANNKRTILFCYGNY